jgi:hypothetical protein
LIKIKGPGGRYADLGTIRHTFFVSEVIQLPVAATHVTRTPRRSASPANSDPVSEFAAQHGAARIPTLISAMLHCGAIFGAAAWVRFHFIKTSSMRHALAKERGQHASVRGRR